MSYSRNAGSVPHKGGERIVQKIAVPIAKVAVYLFAFASWAFAMLLMYGILGMIFREHFEKYRLTIFIILFGCGAFLAAHMRSLIKDGILKATAFFQPAMPSNTDDQTSNPLTTKEPTAMANNENPSFTFTAPVTISTTTNHNAPGGIISNAPVTINQYYDKPKPAPSIIDAEIVEPAPASTDTESQNQNPEPAAADDVIDINGLVAYSVKAKSPGVSRNTIDKILREQNIKPCRTEKDGKVIRNLYPRKESQAAILKYFADKDK